MQRAYEIFIADSPGFGTGQGGQWYVTGSVTNANTVCTCIPNPLSSGQTGYASPQDVNIVNGFNVLLDGVGVGTGPILVAVNFLDFGNGSYRNTAFYAGGALVASPISLTNGTAQIINIPGHWPAIQVAVTNYQTGTGTFRAMIHAY